MPGISLQEFQSLPKSIQDAIQPYRFLAKSVDDARNMAMHDGKWTVQADREYTALNGNKAWGAFDCFTPSAAKSTDFSVAKNVKDAKDTHPERNIYRQYKNPHIQSYVATNDKGNIKYYDKNGKEITREEFCIKEGLTSINYDKKHNTFRAFGVHGREYTIGEAALATAGTGGANLLVSCESVNEFNFYDETTIGIAATIIDDNSAIGTLVAKLVYLLEELNKKQTQVANNTDKISQEIQKLRQELADVKKHIVAILTNQEQFVNTAEQYYKLILNSINGNTEVLKLVVDQLSTGNKTLNDIKELMVKNNKTDEEILETLTKVKYTQDNIQKLLEKLPNDLAVKFKSYLDAIINGIQTNGDKLDELVKLLTLVNDNVVKGNEEQQKAAMKLLGALYAINWNMTGGMCAILQAINNGNKAVIAKMDDIIAMLRTMDANNEVRNNEVLDAIAAIMPGLDKLIEIGKNNLSLQQKANNTLDLIYEVVKKYPEFNFEEIVNAINVNGSNIAGKLDAINRMVTIVNNNVVTGNVQNRDMWCKVMHILTKIYEAIEKFPKQDYTAILTKILNKLDGLDVNVSNGFLAVLNKIGDKAGKGVDLSKIEDTLEKILAAIKNHKVIIKIENDGKPTYTCDNDVNEGVRDDLDWILG